MSGHSTTGVGIRCPSCGIIYPQDGAHDCQAAATDSRAAGQDGAPTPAVPIVTVAADEGSTPVGTILGERYRIIKRLSAGGMGVVYQAQHTVLKSLLAVKVLLHAQSEEARARFLREAQIASQIQHPNTVFISDFGVLPDGRPYLVMEFLQGPTLRDLLEQGALDPLRACRIGAQIARGLRTVHTKGIVHRELCQVDSTCLRSGCTSVPRLRHQQNRSHTARPL